MIEYLHNWPSESIPFLIITVLILITRIILTVRAKKDLETSSYTKFTDQMFLVAIPILIVVLLFVIFNADWKNISELF